MAKVTLMPRLPLFKMDGGKVMNMKRMLRLEEISLNGWPALQTVLYDGWLLRFADGYTKRSNSISPIYGSDLELDGKIAYCEQQYREKGYPVVFKLSPLAQPGRLDDRLAELEYRIVDPTWCKTASLEGLREPAHREAILEPEPSGFWLECVAAMNGLTKMQRDTTQKMMQEQPLDKCFAVLLQDGKPVACGAAVREGAWVGFYDIVTDASSRNKGYGEQLMLHLLHWGKRRGATDAYLLVVQANAAANRLYDKLGFRTEYEYWYRVKA